MPDKPDPPDINAIAHSALQETLAMAQHMRGAFSDMEIANRIAHAAGKINTGMLHLRHSCGFTDAQMDSVKYVMEPVQRMLLQLIGVERR